MSRTLIVGCGYLGRRVGAILAGRGERVIGTTRTPGRAAELAALGIEPVIADVLRPETLAGLPDAGRVFYCVGFDRAAGVPLRTVYVGGLGHALDRLAARSGRWVHASSTGVYGRNDGGWVDEDSPTGPVHESGRVALDAEALVARGGGDRGPAIILRFAGLYGPGRILRRASLLRGEPIVGDPDRFLNLIHVEDAASAAVAALDRGTPGRVYLASDDRPVARREFYGLAAALLGAPAPRFEAPADGDSREDSHKRVSNRRLKDELRVVLRHPDVTTGLPAAVGENSG